VRRRTFIAGLGGAVAWPVVARAQQPGRTYRLGSLHLSPRDAPHHLAFYDELRRLGFIEGQNLVVDASGYGLRIERLAEHAAELIKGQVDIIVCGGDVATHAAQQANGAIPIVAVTDDMVGQGLVRALAQPGSNTTGVSILATELDGKRQEILMGAVPGLRRMAALADSNATAPHKLHALQDAARARGLELLIYPVTKPEEIVPAIDEARTAGAEALNVLATPLLFNNRQVIFERAAGLHLPAMYQFPEMAEEGGLIGYGPRIVHLYRDLLARQVVEILRGVKPADVPVEQPTRFELVINLKAAKAIGLEIPAGLVLRADKLIEGTPNTPPGRR
jgi:putative ABC transport system substrate-binding protein